MNENPNLLQPLKRRIHDQGVGTAAENLPSHLLYNAGGAGYVFNRSYLQLLYQLLLEEDGDVDELAEDGALGDEDAGVADVGQDGGHVVEVH